MLTEGLEHRDSSLDDALLEAASKELDQYNRGLVVLDTVHERERWVQSQRASRMRPTGNARSLMKLCLLLSVWGWSAFQCGPDVMVRTPLSVPKRSTAVTRTRVMRSPLAGPTVSCR